MTAESECEQYRSRLLGIFLLRIWGTLQPFPFLGSSTVQYDPIEISTRAVAERAQNDGPIVVLNDITWMPQFKM
jgi:hypothetical protein